MMQQLAPNQASAEVPINDNFKTLSHQAVYGNNPATSSGLTWGYYGGRWSGFSVAAGTLSLAASQTNHVVVARATGVISTSTSATNWNNDVDYARVYKIVTGGSAVTSFEDHRAGAGGVHGGGSGGGGGGGSTQGKHAIPVSAAAMIPTITAGCQSLDQIELASGQPDIFVLHFDPTSAEYAQFTIPMPEKWNEGTLTAKFYWTHGSTTTNFGVVWGLQAVAIGNDDSLAASYGSFVDVSDTGGTTDDLYITAETAAITVAGTPQAGDSVAFRVRRNPADASDTMAIDARLIAVVIYMTTNADTDA